MKKVIPLLFVFTVFVIACHKKTIPEVTTRTNFPAPPKLAKQPIAENSPEAIAAGKTIFETRCNRCHDLKDTKAYTSTRWTSILQTMTPRARLNDEQAKRVRAYIMANSN